ncbi:nucleoside hydrolase [Microtetraspora fusca]|uniref:Nucleoside hydrolase n=1 Tax=Microtetraspora fusca TaxID=1997 RepID=A0ABW6VDP3_MICFU|nr:nucleoside hydrolase [Microtetraspora fusca]
MPKKATVLVDCDTGVDDAMALLYLLLDPDVEVCGLTTVFGNISAETAAINCLRVLELVGMEHIPVAKGADVMIRGDIPELAPHVHGQDGLGNSNLPMPKGSWQDETAAEMIARIARERPGEVHLIATGPLTNVAIALAMEPELPKLIKHVTIMGGAADAPGNQTPAAEANILHDPEAAQAVLSAAWNTTLVPLDVTMEELITEEHRAHFERVATPVTSFVARITDHYFDFFHAESFDVRCSPCHDALAAAIAVGDVEPIEAPVVNVEVECGYGPGRGATICDTRGRYRGHPPQEGARCRVVLKTDGTFADVLSRRLETWPPPHGRLANGGAR